METNVQEHIRQLSNPSPRNEFYRYLHIFIKGKCKRLLTDYSKKEKKGSLIKAHCGTSIQSIIIKA